MTGGEMRPDEAVIAALIGKAESPAAATGSPSMRSVVEEAMLAAWEMLDKHRNRMNWGCNSDRTKAAVELAGRLLQWDAARMALEAARLRRKAPGAALPA